MTVILTADRSARASVVNMPGGGRWRINSSGQLVDSVLAEWDVADELAKLQLGENGTERKSQMRTPPQVRGNMGVVGIESSPLETSSEASLDFECEESRIRKLVGNSVLPAPSENSLHISALLARNESRTFSMLFRSFFDVAISLFEEPMGWIALV